MESDASITNKLGSASVLPAVIFLLAPLSFYLGNQSEYPISLTELLPYLVATFVATSALLLTALELLRRLSSPLFGIFSALLVTLALAMWVQGHILVWDFGLLDGRGVDWQKWKAHAWTEVLLWSTLVVGGVSLVYRSPKRRTGTTRLAVMLCIFSLAALTIQATTSESAPRFGTSGAEFFRLHSSNNSLLVVLDSFQSEIFQEIVDKHPEDIDFLRGFTFYPDAVGGYPTTYASVSLMLSGRHYRNEIPIREFITQVNHGDNLGLAMNQSGIVPRFATSVAPMTLAGIYASSEIPISMQRIEQSVGRGLLETAVKVVDGGLFRISPTFLKRIVYRDGNWLLTRMVAPKGYPPGFHGADLRFVDAFANLATADSLTDGEFRYIHFALPHWPLRVDENLNFVEDMPAGRAAVVAQSRGALKLLKRLVNILVDLGIYTDSEILVVSDHGVFSLPLDYATLSAGETSSTITSRRHASALPLFLHKPSGVGHGLEISNAAVQLSDVPCFLQPTSEMFDCSGLSAARQSKVRLREFYYYRWGDEDWNRSYMPEMTQYHVTGNAWDRSAWRDTGARFADGEAWRVDVGFPEFTMEKPIDAGVKAHASVFGNGWGEAEGSHRWTIADAAIVQLSIGRPLRAPARLRLLAAGYYDEKIVEQMVAVTVNGQTLGQIALRDLEWHELEIPAEIYGAGALTIVFYPTDPTPPCKKSGSADCRLLGMKLAKLLVVGTNQGQDAH